MSIFKKNLFLLYFIMSIRVMQMKARNKEKLRNYNSRTIYNQNSINTGRLRASCSSSNQKIATPQVSHANRMDRARRGLGYMGGKVIGASKKLTHKKMTSNTEISSKTYIEKLKMRTIAQSDKNNTAATGKCKDNSNTVSNEAECTSCSGSRRKDVNVAKDVHIMSSEEYLNKLVPKRVDNIICYDPEKDKAYGNTTSKRC